MMRYANIIYNDVCNTDGLALCFYTQGCPHHCKGCFQKETWDFNGGKELSQNIINQLIYCLKNFKYDYLCLLGGEPLSNLNVSKYIIDLCKQFQPNIKVWCYTGYKLEDAKKYNILNDIDIIVDGKFEEDKYDAKLKFRGSSNQKIYKKIDNKWSDVTCIM